MTSIEEVTDALVAFRDERDWRQFHDSRNLALAIAIEAAELNELFLWSKGEGDEVDQARLREELADVFAFALMLAERHDLDVCDMILEKIEKNSEKYPVEKSKGTSTKYTEL